MQTEFEIIKKHSIDRKAMICDRSLTLLLITIYFTNAIYGLASPFLPQVLEQKNIQSVWTGVIFSAYAIASTISAIVTGKVLNSIGHGPVITFGGFLMAGSIVGFGFLEYFDKPASVISIAIVLRLCQGTASGMINTAAYAFASTAYTDDVDKVISIMEAIVGLGCAMGPVLGSFVYVAVGFQNTFVIFGLALTPIAILILCLLKKPQDIKNNNQIEGEDDEAYEQT